ncbi:aromatic ring-hydroxylating dioxygenase subunit alpha [Mangrovimicrobium sediminis]|uniref:Aromatic ring-hydroxylating dioxygenase subunit alpha n=1 Tax=Mangrovimicrobium sediminis TaxID=2562682 RepID=A0A4Z0LX26_9GAMM|nr:aromatic ring-hydroxylating dioxygenase subunit alpha [Haliea sp. SAOS-164]TGD71706.1 aromatic ring-hydroxylating dioxygenase subunit alpha [Haliea sp. SAOS-164]
MPQQTRSEPELPGAAVDNGPYLSELDFSAFRMQVSTDRYNSTEYLARERELLWMRTWQVAGREDELPDTGDWTVYTLFDQSFVIARGRDGQLRGFVNACRHRGNQLCEGSGHAARFTCPYHRWSFDLDGQLVGVPRPDFDGSLEVFVGEREALGLVRVPVECFAGFMFINPDPQAAPLADYLGEVVDLLAPYRMHEMVPVGINVREALDCNWKVIMDAFQEGYHIQGVHPELIPAMDESRERYRFYGDHSVATAPFGASNLADISPADQVAAIRELPATFPGVAEVLPRFEELLEASRGTDGELVFTEAVNARSLLQQATRDTLTAKGLDVSGLTDTQMSDNHFYLLFPNFFLTIRAGEATFISSVPHPDGDPNRCIWHVTGFMWLPPEERAAARAPLVEVSEPGSFEYFLALQQDYEQMQRQQKGLRNTRLEHMALTRQEVRLAWFHEVLDRWVAQGPA